MIQVSRALRRARLAGGDQRRPLDLNRDREPLSTFVVAGAHRLAAVYQQAAGGRAGRLVAREARRYGPAVAKPTRKARQEQKLPKKKATPSASSLEVARRAAALPVRAQADETDDEAPSEKKVATPAAKQVAASPGRSAGKAAKPARGGETPSRRASAREASDDEALAAATDPIAASKSRAGRFVAGAIAIVAVVVGVTWYADSSSKGNKLEKVEQQRAPLKGGDEVTVFDPDHEKSKEAEAKAAAKATSQALEPKAAETAAAPPASAPPSAETVPSAAAKPEPPAPPPAKEPPAPKPPAPAKPEPPAPPKPAAPPSPPAPPKPPAPKSPSGDPYE